MPEGIKRVLRWLLFGLLLALAWQLLRPFFPAEEREVRSQLRETLSTQFPAAADASAQRFGLRRFAPHESAGRDVVLIHGLDDPGKVWMNMAPALSQAGYRVWVLDYPNDQAIGDSAVFLRRQLAAAAGLHDGLAIVAHSMGGLVSREMLGSLAADCGSARCGVPQVTQLIMIGTPNHGSEMARLRGLGEVREQASRLLNGEAGWLDWIVDGAGEAGLDLLPGSDFLRALNARPQPPGVAMQVIAGVIGDQQLQQIDRLLADYAEGVARPASGAGEAWGDGLVSLESARLAGVPLMRVAGNHLSIVRNVSEHSDRVPPAVPLVLQMLAAPQAGLSRP